MREAGVVQYIRQTDKVCERDDCCAIRGQLRYDGMPISRRSPLTLPGHRLCHNKFSLSILDMIHFWRGYTDRKRA